MQTQVQLPDSLYNELTQIAQREHSTLSDVLSKAGQMLVSSLPKRAKPTEEKWTLPKGENLGPMLVAPEDLRDVLYGSLDDESMRR